ncbi:glutamate receptor 3-like isoform X2 [Actinia tenebrosa]|uniref:Glutamate receptor 3-like isoform X2 n=1 Tax=Actinia tenebrosa TaxID=6105 RepID=A0A6P8H3D2_ACTTE|nr:glutamate receptor 3-like isoform X2 [Actinia tenebrosa]
MNMLNTKESEILHSSLWFMVLLLCCIIQGESCVPIKIEMNTESDIEFLATQRALQMYNESNFTFESRNKNNMTAINLYEYVQSLLDHDVAVIIEGMGTSKQSCSASAVANIPLIRIHDRVNREISTSLQFCQPSFALNAGYEDYSEAVMSILDMFGWNTMTLIYDTDRFHEVAFFSSLSLARNCQLHYINAQHTNEDPKSDDNIYRIVKQIQTLSSQVHILFIDIEMIKKILEKVLLCHTNQSNTIWIISGAVPMKLSAINSHIVIGFRQSLNDEAAARDLVANITNHLAGSKDPSLGDYEEDVALASDAVLVAMDAIRKQIADGFWTRGNSSKTVTKRGSILNKYISKVSTRGMTGSIAFDEKGRRKDVQFDVLNLRNNLFVKTGSYDRTQPLSRRLHLTDNLEQNSEENKTNHGRLEGSKLKVVTVLETPFVMKTNKSDGSFVYEGYAIDLLKEIAKQHKFIYEIYESPDGMYGAEENGRWNGAIKELLDGNADIAVTALTITEAREKVVDFTASYEYYTEDLLIKKDTSKEGLDLMHFLSPFTIENWTAVLLVLLLVATVLYSVNFCSPYGMKNEGGSGTAPEFCLSNCMWFSVACMLQQGADYQPKPTSARILAGSFWFYVLVWVATYTAYLAATFTVDQRLHSINSLEGAIDSGRKFTFLNGSNVYSFFRDTDFPLYKKVWERMIISSSTADAVKLVRQNNAIYISGGTISEYTAGKNPCDLRLVPGLTTPEGMGFALKSGDPRLDNMTLSILYLRDNGHMSKLKRKWWLFKHDCVTQTQTSSF